jgi:hypothetical protein
MFTLLPIVVISSTPVSPATATPPAPQASAETHWTALDRELDALALTATSQDKGPSISGWLRSRAAFSSDVDASAAAGSQDLAGFNMDDIRLVLSGSAAEGWSYTVSLEAGDPAISDASGSGVGLFDAYATVALGDQAAVSIGRLSATFLWSSGIGENQRLFLDKTFVGEFWDGRDVGFEISGSAGGFRGWAAVQNGSDSVSEELALSARVSFHVLGDALPACEGSCGLGEARQLTIGAAWFDDTGLDEGTAIGADVFFASGRWSASAEIVDFGDDLGPVAAVNSSTGAVIPGAIGATGAQTSWNAALAFALVPDTWEIAARWQDLDDDAGTTIASASVVRYVAGHSIKWTAQVDSADSDDPALEVDTLAVGLAVGF